MPSSDQTAMPTKFAVVEVSGRINIIGIGDASMVPMQATEPGDQILADTDLNLFGVIKVAIPDSIDDETHYWKNGEFVPYPTRPGEWATFDYDTGQWTGTPPAEPTQEEIDAAEQARIEETRNAAFLPKLEFVLRTVGAGLISRESGLEILDGKVPAELQPLTDEMSPDELFQLQAKIKGAIQFNRMDPFILVAGGYLGLTPQQMDAVFGIS